MLMATFFGLVANFHYTPLNWTRFEYAQIVIRYVNLSIFFIASLLRGSIRYFPVSTKNISEFWIFA